MHTIVVQASDLAGNKVLESHDINVDLNPPYTTPTASGQKGPGLAGLPWFRSPVSVEANAGDAAGGPVSVEYSLNGAAYQDGGMVPVENVVGTAFATVWPYEHWKTLGNPYSD